MLAVRLYLPTLILKDAKMLRKLLFTSLSIFVFTVFSQAQKDSLILNNGNVIVGEIKSMDKGVVQIETPYSDSDFKIEWGGIDEIYAKQTFLITLNDGTRINGSFESKDSSITIHDDEGNTSHVHLDDIVYMNSLDDGFMSRLSANIDIGFSLAKAQNQTQLTSNSRIGYLADLWSLDLYYNTLFSKQDETEDIQRNDFGIGYRYFLPKDWYLSADLNFLSNTEQSLDLRTVGKLGAGNYIVHSNRAYWGVGAGVSFNNETFRFKGISDTDSTSTNQSLEGYIGTELNLYDIGDLNLFTGATLYPSFTEPGRVRLDFNFDAKYDDLFIKDFYIRAGLTLNYDSQPPIAGKEVDYVFTTGFGWEL